MTDDYLTLVIHHTFAAGDIGKLFALMFLFFGRMFPIIILSPFLGSKVLPHPVKVTIGLSLFVIFLPRLLEVNTSHLHFGTFYFFLFIKEVFIGILIGTIISIPFFICQNAGMFIDHQRGGASLMTNDPTVQNQSSPFGTLFNYIMILIFYHIGGPFIFFEAILTSYEIVPPDTLLSRLFFSGEMPMWQEFFNLFNKMMVLSIQLASPGLITILMTDVFLGITNRLAPQVQITFLGMPLKSFIAMIVIWIGLKNITGQFVIEANDYLNQVKQMVQYLIPAS